MPSRRALLAAATASTTALAGCTRLPGVSVPRIDGQPCPPVDVAADRSVCSHHDPEEIVVTASSQQFSTERESLESLSLDIENGTDTPLVFDGDRWRLFRNEGFGWSEREVDVRGSDSAETIEAGESFGWHGIDAMFELGAAGPTPAGLYAAVLPVDDDGARVVCVFLFRVTRH